MQKTLDKFLENLKETFKERLSSVFLYGSCAVEDCSKSFSDINMMVIIDNLKAEDLKKSHKSVKAFAQKGKYLPIFMDKDEWFSSSDVYAIEYSDIKDRYKILHGQNLISNLSIEKTHLRFQCEQEVKSLLIRLRQTYVSKAFDTKAIKNLIQTSSKTFIVIFRTVLKLSNITVPKNHEDVVKLFADNIQNHGIDFDCNLFLKILEYRKNPKAIKNDEIEELIQKMIDSTNYVLKYVDKIEI